MFKDNAAKIVIAAVVILGLMRVCGEDVPDVSEVEQGDPYYAWRHAPLYAGRTTASEVVDTLEPGELVFTTGQMTVTGRSSRWLAARLRDGTSGYVEEENLREVTFPRLGVAVDSAEVEEIVGQFQRCPSVRRLQPGARYLLRRQILTGFARDSIIVDVGCYQSYASSDVWQVTWAKTSLFAFAPLDPSARACPDLYGALSDEARRTLRDRWVRLPTTCEIFGMVPLPELFAGRESYALGATGEYELGDEIEEPLLTPSILVGDSLMAWEELMPPDVPFGLHEVSLVRDAPGYRLVARTWTETAQLAYPFVTLEILRTSVDPLRVERVLERGWSEGREAGEYEVWALQPDGSVTSNAGGVCRYDEGAATYACTGG